MEQPRSPGEAPSKAKRKPSLRRYLRKQGIEVPPVVPRTRDSALPPKRKRSYRRPNRRRANKKKKLAAGGAAATDEDNVLSSSAASPAAEATSSSSSSPVAASPPVVLPSPAPVSSPAAPSLPVAPSSPAVPSLPAPEPAKPSAPHVGTQSTTVAKIEAANQYVCDPVDPLGLFDELEGPLEWPSEGLFD
ncbi:hypothetical protein N7517_006662 [Penicillium concentricum]|uniref:Uncharacterized protein n=1 Tax=Penicillium concentricum TaxID=293559 RepID=A0A9W9S9P7_9EURO|nr:uncharacterized protein N7517_006662 [Penicillium concentricum]KAJ5374656.1 hypothetical protein N7517_006662 [Penicillium concentricum]